MSVDVLDIEWCELFCQCGAHHGVAQRADAANGRSSAIPQQGLQQLPEVVRIGGEPAHRPYQLIVGERLKKARLFPESAFRQTEVVRRDPFAAAADHLRPAAAQFCDFIDHVRFEGRRKLVGDVGDSGHATDSSDAQSMPATVNISPMTNWYAMSTKKALKRYTLSKIGQTLRREATGPDSPGGPRQERRKRLKKRMPYRANPGTPNSTSMARFVHVEGAEVVALHAAGKLGVHTSGRPTGERPLLKHRPAGVVHGEPRRHRTALRGAVPKNCRQRMIA